MPDCIGLRGCVFQHEGFRAAALACLDIRHLPAGCHGSILRHESLGFTFEGGGIAVLDEQPVVSLAAIAITLHSHEHPTAVHALAFHDINPQAPTHVLLIPKRELPRLADAGPDARDLLGHLMLAAGTITRQLGAEVLAACFIIDLPDLGGADKLRKLDVPVRTLMSFEGH